MQPDTFAEATTIAGLEKAYMTESRMKTYTACEDMNFHWDMSEVKEFRKMWRKGMHLVDISIELGRHQAEVMFLAYDQAENGKIEPRNGGIFGSVQI